MPGFDVLDPHLALYQSHFIEASAGTGKTFAIENIVLRLLLDKDGPTIEQILVVTFTKKATFELKSRILSRIEKALAESQDEAAKKRLRHALLLFDEAKIFTIHGFCYFALKEFAFESDFFLEEEENTSSQVLVSIMKDFLRTEMAPELLHPRQLAKLLKFHQNEITLLAKKLASLANERLPVEGARPYKELKAEIVRVITELKAEFAITKDKLESDLACLAPCFGQLLDRQKNIKAEVQKDFQKFVTLFEEVHEDFFDLSVLKMVPANRLKREIPKTDLYYPHLLEVCQEKLFPLFHEASDPLLILGCLADKARIFLEEMIEKKELIFFEDLLRKMEKALQNPWFAEEIKKSFRAVLIDEFQDTDPLQWRIFSQVFHKPEFGGPLYLVGDPKQSIYNFRGADVYTYLEAKKSLPKERRKTLLYNYRSDPGLVEALNTLFSKDFLFLPKTKETLLCPPVYPAAPSFVPIEDGKGSVHFFMAENEQELFAFVSNEILRLKQEQGFPLSAFAVLVKDRYQLERFVKTCGLPVAVKEHKTLAQTEGFYLLYCVLKAVLNPHDLSYVVMASLSSFFDLKEKNLDEMLKLFYQYNQLLQSEGIFSLFQTMMQKATISDEKIYLSMLQIVEILAVEVKSKEDILPTLQKLKGENQDAEEFKVRSFDEKDAVQVMTIHISKGLEFPFVFPIGLALASIKKRDFVRDEKRVALKEHHEEAEAEKMRQLYVAFTRAKQRLYVPYLEGEENSPISRLVQKELTALCEKSAQITYSNARDLKKMSSLRAHDSLLYPPPIPSIDGCVSSIHSFSSQAHPTFKAVEKNEKTLPQGIQTGVLLHRILEEIPLGKDLSQQNILDLVTAFLKNTHLEEWSLQVKDIVFQILNMHFTTAKTSFTLKDLDPGKCFKEWGFLFAEEQPKGFCKGFVDLFFEHDGSFYFLDWKSNDLGGDYSDSKMQETILEHQYDLQAKIYSEAVIKYLKLFQKEESFQGCFYVFLRGSTYIYNRWSNVKAE